MTEDELTALKPIVFVSSLLMGMVGYYGTQHLWLKGLVHIAKNR